MMRPYLVTVRLVDQYWETQVYVKAMSAGEALVDTANKFLALSHILKTTPPVFLVVDAETP